MLLIAAQPAPATIAAAANQTVAKRGDIMGVLLSSIIGHTPLFGRTKKGSGFPPSSEHAGFAHPVTGTRLAPPPIMSPLRELLASDHRQTLEFFFRGLLDLSDADVDREEALYNASV